MSSVGTFEMNSLTQDKHHILAEWREQCRSNLLELERKSIAVRVCVSEKIINEKTSEVNRMLCINTTPHNITPFKHLASVASQCKFIENWNGLNMNQMRSLPKSLQEYENRAKNWLNGRRAINYAQTLFPEILLCAEQYSKVIGKQLFSSNVSQQCLYSKILLFSYVSGICSGRVALYDGHHRASLICENSIKKEGNLKRLLQKFYQTQTEQNNDAAFAFPKHLQDAIDFFKRQYH